MPLFIPPAGDVLQWGNDSISATTTTRFMTYGWGDALAATADTRTFKAPRLGKLRNLYIHVNNTAGNGNNIVYTILINGVASTLTVTLASTAADGNDLTNVVDVAEGDLISLRVTKAASVGTAPTNVTATAELL
jgi:hypothetical protein